MTSTLSPKKAPPNFFKQQRWRGLPPEVEVGGRRVPNYRTDTCVHPRSPYARYRKKIFCDVSDIEEFELLSSPSRFVKGVGSVGNSLKDDKECDTLQSTDAGQWRDKRPTKMKDLNNFKSDTSVQQWDEDF